MRLVFLISIFILFLGNGWALEITSASFDNGGYIPSQHTCDSEDFSVSVSWQDVPLGVKSFTIICDDPDAPIGNWVHWVIYNIPQDKNSLAAGLPKKEVLEDSSIQARNDFGNFGYGGPCPPPGRPHRYFFKLYALDILFPREAGLTKDTILKAMQGHILAEARIMGLYKRQGR